LQPPPSGFIKANWDTSFDPKGSRMRIGVVFRGEQGFVLAAMSMVIPHITDLAIVEEKWSIHSFLTTALQQADVAGNILLFFYKKKWKQNKIIIKYYQLRQLVVWLLWEMSVMIISHCGVTSSLKSCWIVWGYGLSNSDFLGGFLTCSFGSSKGKTSLFEQILDTSWRTLRFSWGLYHWLKFTT
jgi:hypothetical protein